MAAAADVSNGTGDAGGVLKVIRAVGVMAFVLQLLFLLASSWVVGAVVLGEVGDRVINGGTTSAPLRFRVSLSPPFVGKKHKKQSETNKMINNEEQKTRLSDVTRTRMNEPRTRLMAQSDNTQMVI